MGSLRYWRVCSCRVVCHGLIAFFFLFHGLAFLHAQDAPVDKETEGSEDSQKINRSLVIDIQNAEYDELLAWCRVLNLAEDGDDEVLRSRLRDYYGVEPPALETGDIVGTKVVVESAQKGEYFKVEIDSSNSEAIIRLSGGVVITADTANRKHRVESDQVVFNQTRNTITAEGNIAYRVVIDGKEEKYSGDSIVFRISNWTGIIFQGTAERTQVVGEETVDFFFKGKSIRQPEEGTLVFNDGTITSDPNPNPYYALRAKKIWITGSSEWALLSATLYVGHIPVFYLPFYWKSGGDLFFNPVIGNRNRVGYYIQTSTYLVGQKKSKDEYPIMGFGGSGGSDYELVREGLFLTRKEESGETTKGNTLKYMLDVYTSLGAMTGFLGEFAVKKVSINFYATIAVSRSVTADGNVYFRDSGEAKVYWNSSQIGDVQIPFRWGTDLDLKIDDWSLFLNWYSDPFYLKDFDNRKEDFDWLSYLLGEEGTDVEQEDLVTELKWEIKGSEKLELMSEKPWFEDLAINNLGASLTWRNKSNQKLDKSNDPDKEHSPLRSFYYPYILILPDLKLSLSGKSPTWSLDRSKPPEASKNVVDVKAGGNSRMLGTNSIPFRDSFDSIYSNKLLEASIDYDIQTQLYIEHQSDSSDWSSPSDINFDFKPAKINTSPQGHLSYSFDFWDSLTGVNGTTILLGFHQTHIDMFGEKSHIDDETRLVDYQDSKFLWNNGIGFYFKPLRSVTAFSDSSLSYDADASIYTYRFSNDATVANPSYSSYWLSGKEDFRKHLVSLAVIWRLGAFNASFVNAADIPPLDQRYSLSSAVGFDYEGWKLDISQQTLQVSNRWTAQPLIMKASWEGWKDEVKISQSARYDIDNNRFADAETAFKFWGFGVAFVANYGIYYNWNQGNLTWEEGPEGFAPRHLKFSFYREFKPAPIWKNRIRLRSVIDTSWNINLNQPTDNVFEFKWIQEFHTYKFIDFKLAFSTTNQNMYTYFPWWREKFNIQEKVNFFEDLLKSLNIFNAQDRYESHFNMERLDLTLVHHLGSWDLTVQYGGWPAYDSGRGSYSWKSDFNISVKWKPLLVFNQATTYKDDNWSVDSFEN